MEKCPCCEREFEKFKDFPLIYLKEFSRLEIPDELEVSRGGLPRRVRRKFLFWEKMMDNPLIPKEVSKFFQSSNEEIFIHQNLIYQLVKRDSNRLSFPAPHEFYEIFERVPNKAKELAQCPEVLSTINILEELVGNTVKTKDILVLSGFKCLEYHGKKDLCLSFGGEKTEGETRTTKLILTADIGDYDCHIGGSPIGIYQDLAELTYNGRVN